MALAVSVKHETSAPDRRRFHVALAASAALGATVALLLTQMTPIKAFEAFAADVRISLFGGVMPERHDIAIIAVDEAALRRFPFRSPVNRAFLARLVEAIDRRGARVIGVDLLLDRPTIPEDDAALAAALRAAHAEIVLVTQPAPGTPPSAACAPEGPAIQVAPLAEAFGGLGRLGDGVLCADEFDGVFRYAPVPDTRSGRMSFADAVAAAAGADPFDAAASRAGPARLAVGPNGSWPFPTYSATLIENLPADWLRDRVVLVGAVTPRDDLHITPLRYARLTSPIEPAALMPDNMLPAVVVHAYLVAQRLDGATGPRVRLWRETALAIIAAVAGVMLAVAPWPGWLKSTALAGAVAGYWLFALFVFAASGMLLGLSAFSLSLALASGLAVTTAEHVERSQKRFLRGAFEHYLAPQVVGELIRDPARLSLAAQEREISVLFADLESFTRFADTHDPAVVTSFMNDYFDRLISVIHAHGGTVDKIMGDSIIAFFSAPIVDPRHRVHCVRCALALDAAAREVTAAHAQRGGAPGVTRIGAHTGRALVGNFGGSSRFDYTAQGSTMNLASRLERANKIIRTRICVSAAAKVAAPDLAYRTIGRVRLRGFAEPIDIYEPLDATTADFDRIARYEAALTVARTNVRAARAALEELAAEDEDDALVAFQLQRLEAGLLGEVIET